MNFGRLFALSHQLVLVIPSEVEESLETILLRDDSARRL